MDEGKEAGSEFIIACSDATKLLELEEEGFHQMTFLIQPPIDKPWVRVIRFGRDAEVSLMIGDKLSEFPLAISLVSEDSRTPEVNLAQQNFGNGDVSRVASSQKERNRVTQCINSGMNLGASASTTDTNALIDLIFG